MSTFEELSITLPDGYESYARYWPAPEAPASASDAPAILYLHGIQSHCGWYPETARAFQQAGFAVLQPDRRGSGRNETDRGHAESATQLIDDGFACIEKLTALSGAKQVHIVGVSWGGKLAASMHVTRPECARTLTLVAPGIFPIVDVSNAEKFRIGWSMVAHPEKRYDIPLNDAELFTADPEKIRFLENDELTLHQASAGFYLASRRMDKIWSKLGEATPVPLHLTLAGNERIIDNDRTRDFVRDLPWPTRQISFYENSRHTIEYGPDRAQFIEDLIAFMKNPTA